MGDRSHQPPHKKSRHKFKLSYSIMLSEAWIDFAAGWISGGVSVLVIQPIDTVLTRLQANTIPIGGSSSANVAKLNVNPVVGPQGASTMAISGNIFRSMIADFGLRSLWRGSGCMIGAVPVQNALLMTGYGVGKRWSGYDDDGVKNADGVLVGVFLGGCTGECIMHHIWMVCS